MDVAPKAKVGQARQSPDGGMLRAHLVQIILLFPFIIWSFSGTHAVPIVVVGAAGIYWIIGLMCLNDIILMY